MTERVPPTFLDLIRNVLNSHLSKASIESVFFDLSEARCE